jgi:glutamate-5-semialdehyde dehydrogenase
MATAQSVAEVCREAKDAAHLRAGQSSAKDACLRDLADRIDGSVEALLEANRADVEAGREEGLNEALIDRLTLTVARIAEMAKGVREIAELDDPVGEVIEGWTLENGLEVAKKRVPIGVVAVVYEARPNVTVDAAALCLKSGNAAVLRGSSSAESSNAFLAGLIGDALAAAELPLAAVSLVSGGGHEQLTELATAEDLVDLIIPRGGEGLKNALKAVAKVPVMYAAAGNCHVYVHQDADLEMAERIAFNAKVQRPGVCNAAETLLVHRDVVGECYPTCSRS